MSDIYNSLKESYIRRLARGSVQLLQRTVGFGYLCLEEIIGLGPTIIRTRRDSDVDRPHYLSSTPPDQTNTHYHETRYPRV